MINDRAKEIFKTIKDYITNQGYPPSIREISQMVHMSVARVHDYLIILEREGYIERKEKQPRAIRVLK